MSFGLGAGVGLGVDLWADWEADLFVDSGMGWGWRQEVGRGAPRRWLVARCYCVCVSARTRVCVCWYAVGAGQVRGQGRDVEIKR